MVARGARQEALPPLTSPDTVPQVLPCALQSPMRPQAPHRYRCLDLGGRWSTHAHQQCHPEVVGKFAEGQDGYWPLVGSALERGERVRTAPHPYPN